MNKGILSLLLALFLLTVPVLSEALEFQNISMGMSQENVYQIIRYQTVLGKSMKSQYEDTNRRIICPDTQHCIGIFNVKGLNLEGTFWFGNRGLDHITLTFNPSSYGLLSSALAEKYGRPTNVSREPAQNLMGATVENVTSVWAVSGGYIAINKYEGKLTEGVVLFASEDYMSRVNEQKRAADKGPGF